MPEAPFVERRQRSDANLANRDRRQFGNNYDDLSPEARDLAQAVDGYKLRNRRRFVTYEEILSVVKDLGYRKEA